MIVNPEVLGAQRRASKGRSGKDSAGSFGGLAALAPQDDGGGARRKDKLQ